MLHCTGGLTLILSTGINNTFLEIDLVINVKMNVIIPYLAKQTYLTKVIKSATLLFREESLNIIISP